MRNECFRSRISTSTSSTKAPPTVINTLFNIMGSLNNYIFINIYYNSISRILRGEIHYYNITDLINRIVQVLKGNLYWVKISTRDAKLMEPVKL